MPTPRAPSPLILVACGLAWLQTAASAAALVGEDSAVASPSGEARRLQGDFKRAGTADARREVSEQFISE